LQQFGAFAFPVPGKSQLDILLYGMARCQPIRTRTARNAPNQLIQIETGGRLMLVVRNCFVAKPGMASKLAAQLKDAAVTAKLPRHRILTDLTGEFNRVIMEYEAENVAEFDAQMKYYATNEAFRAKMKGYTDLWISGSREILQVA
jgi:hypothetical protein